VDMISFITFAALSRRFEMSDLSSAAQAVLAKISKHAVMATKYFLILSPLNFILKTSLSGIGFGFQHYAVCTTIIGSTEKESHRVLSVEGERTSLN
jgi:hypothetical protein